MIEEEAAQSAREAEREKQKLASAAPASGSGVERRILSGPERHDEAKTEKKEDAKVDEEFDIMMLEGPDEVKDKVEPEVLKRSLMRMKPNRSRRCAVLIQIVHPASSDMGSNISANITGRFIFTIHAAIFAISLACDNLASKPKIVKRPPSQSYDAC